MKPGQLIPKKSDIRCNDGRTTVIVDVENTSDKIVHICSHYHFFETNKRLRFNRRVTYGRRLDIPAGTAIRWEPKEVKTVELTEFTGKRRIYGFHGFVNGPLDESEINMESVRRLGFLDTEGSDAI